VNISAKNSHSPRGSLLRRGRSKLQSPGIPPGVSQKASEEQARGTAHVENRSALPLLLNIIRNPGEHVLSIQFKLAFQLFLSRVSRLEMCQQLGGRWLRKQITSPAVKTFSEEFAVEFGKVSLSRFQAQGTTQGFGGGWDGLC
jgi:hypothetical protein